MSNISSILKPQNPELDPEGNKPPVVVQQLIVRPTTRKSQDIGNWRDAMRSAEATVPRRVELYDLYEDILLDAHLRSVVEKRLMAVTNIEWTFSDAEGNEIEQLAEWCDTPDFERIVREILNSKLWGYSMLELSFHPDGGIGSYLIPRKHMRPLEGQVSVEQTGNGSIDIRTGIYAETVLELGDPRDLGLLLAAAQYAIIKRGNISDYALFTEVFGMPLIDAVWDGYDEKQKVLLLEALDKFGSGGQMVRPAGTQLEFKQGGQNNPTGDLYMNLAKFCNSEMSKLFVGQTETTESSPSSGQAQATVHADTEDDINRSDRNFVRRILNRRLKAMLEANGIDTKDGKFHEREAAGSEMPLDQRILIDAKLRNELQLPMSDDHLYATYGIDRPDDYEDQKRALIERGAQPQQPFSLHMPVHHHGRDRDDGILHRLRHWASGLFSSAPAAGADINMLALLADHYAGACCDHDQLITLTDSSPLDEEMIRRIFTGELKDGQIDADYTARVSKLLMEAVVKGMGKPTGKADDAQTKMYEHFRANVHAFSSAKSLALMREYSKQLTDDKGGLRSYEAFRREVMPIGVEFNDNYLRTEFRSAHANAQMADKWEKVKKYSHLEYRTVGDSRVRSEHAALHGVVLRTDDRLWQTIFPPNGWGCRCTVIPAEGAAESGYETAKDYAKSGLIKPYFKRNPGTEMQAFPEEHPYFSRPGHQKGKEVEFMAEENYAMPSVEAIMKRELPKLQEAINEKVAADAWAKANKKVTAIDGIGYELPNRWGHVVGDSKKEARWKFIGNATEVMKDADEVWVSKKDGQSFKRYVKYYSGQPVVVSLPIDAPDDWTIWKGDDQQMRDNVRRGVLIVRK